MIFLTISLFVLSLVDAIQPQKIAIILRLVPLSKSKAYPLIFIVTILLTYFILGVVVYFGMIVYSEEILKQLLRYYQSYVAVVGIIAAIVLIVYSLYHLVVSTWSVLHPQNKVEVDEFSKFVRATNPQSLIFSAIFLTISTFPAALPYFTFISIVINMNIMQNQVLLYLMTYSLVYSSFMLFIYAYMVAVPQASYKNIEHTIKNRVQKASVFAKPLLYVLIALLILRTSFILL